MENDRLQQLKEKFTKGFLPLAILAGTGVIFMLLLFLRADIPNQKPQERVWNVSAFEAKVENIQPVLRVFGEVVAGRKVSLRALVSGEIIQIHRDFREGGIVDEGDELFQIDPFNYNNNVQETAARLSESQAKLEELLAQKQQEEDLLNRAKEQADISSRDLVRAEKLALKGHISQKTLDDRKLTHSRQLQLMETSRNTLSIKEARIVQQEGAVTRSEIELATAERELARTSLKAPFRGFLSEINAAAGRVVNINDPIAELTDADQLEVRFHLSDVQFGRIISSSGSLKGESIKISWNVGDKPLTYNGTIIRIGAQISQAAGGVSIFSDMDIRDSDSALRPGAFVQVHLPDRKYENVVRLPANALFNGNIVYAIVEDRLVPRSVEVIGQIGDDIIIKTGVKNGERIMTTWFAEAGPGTKVFAPQTSAER
jgi:RND family efflux transporter MFP subunit